MLAVGVADNMLAAAVVADRDCGLYGTYVFLMPASAKHDASLDLAVAYGRILNEKKSSEHDIYLVEARALSYRRVCTL